MAQQADEAYSTEPYAVTQEIRVLGTGASAPTKQVGRGVTITRTGVGVHRITWSESQGTFVNWSCSLAATTMADLKGFTVVRGVYNATARTLDYSIFNSSFAAAELSAAQFLDIKVTFKKVNA